MVVAMIPVMAAVVPIIVSISFVVSVDSGVCMCGVSSDAMKNHAIEMMMDMVEPMNSPILLASGLSMFHHIWAADGSSCLIE